MKKIMLSTITLAFLQLLSIPLKAQTYDISTVAGDGIAGFSGDGGMATSAELNFQEGIAIDAAGNIYIADYNNNRIRKLTTSGMITTVAGDGGAGYSGDGSAATSAELNAPEGVKADVSGNIFIGGHYDNRVRTVNTSGIISTVAGNGTAGYLGDGGAATDAELYRPYGVAVDASGNVYITDFDNNCIREVSTSGIISTIAGNGSAGFNGDGGAATAAELNDPQEILVDASGNIFFCDQANNRIRKINTSGIISTVAGNGTAGFSGDGGAATAAELNTPGGIAIDGKYIYISDQSNNRIRTVDVNGIIRTIAGNGTASFSGDGGAALSAEMDSPTGIAVDASGNVYFSDWYNSRIRKLTLVTTGIAENNFNNATINVFPNPSNGIFNIVQKNTFQKSSLEIYNVLGKRIVSTMLTTDQTQINLSSEAKGVYFYKVVSEDGKSISDGKIVVE